MDDAREQPVRNLLEPAVLRELDQVSPHAGLLGGTGPGRGVEEGEARDASWGDGSFNGSRTTTLNNGNSFGRTTSATANGDGTANYSTTFTGPQGATRTVSGTVPRRP